MRTLTIPVSKKVFEAIRSENISHVLLEKDAHWSRVLKASRQVFFRYDVVEFCCGWIFKDRLTYVFVHTEEMVDYYKVNFQK